MLSQSSFFGTYMYLECAFKNSSSAEWAQEQRNRKIMTYARLYGLIDKTINRIVKKYQEKQ